MAIDSFVGIYRLLYSGWHHLSTQQRQGQESQSKGLPGEGQVDRRGRSGQHVHRFCRLRGKG